jgi:hypothetical protein
VWRRGLIIETGAGGRGVIPEGAGAELTDWIKALGAWVGRGRPATAFRWMGRELDPDGVPLRMAVADWPTAFQVLDRALRERPEGWPDGFDATVEGWFRALLRFSRPDGSPAFGPPGPNPNGDRRTSFKVWADRLADPGLTTVVDWWFPAPGDGRGRVRRRHVAPPLPADSRPDRPLAVLRANWATDGDFVAVDHRAPGWSSLVEVAARGRPWLGPTWGSGERTPGPPARPARARPTLWVSQSSADAAEWSFRAGRARVTRTAVLLRGRRLALLAEQWDGPEDPGAWHVSLADGVEATPVDDRRGFALAAVAGRSRGGPRAYPIGLPRLSYPTERGSFDRLGGDLVLRTPPAGRRTWRPLLLSWEPLLERKAVHWRTLTVTEGRRVCRPDEAFAARISWGRGETLLVYRSLGRRATRAFLGHQTDARFLVGLFSTEGEVEPLLKVEE